MDLLHELLVKVLRHLTLQERLAGPALVCRSWHAASHLPDLISTVKATFTIQPRTHGCQLVEHNLSSLAQWLERHAAAVQELHLAVRCTQPIRMSREQEEILLLQLWRCEAACAVARVLRTLSVRCEARVRLRLEPPPAEDSEGSEGDDDMDHGDDDIDHRPGFAGTSLLSLRELSVCAELRGYTDLSMLSALQQLSLRQAASVIGFNDHARLPKSLTALDIGFADWVTPANRSESRHVCLNSVIWRLPRLQSLQVHGRAGPLTAFWSRVPSLAPTLQRLRVADFDGLPPGLVPALGYLTSLRLLELVDLRGEGVYFQRRLTALHHAGVYFQRDDGPDPAGPGGHELGASLGRLCMLTGLVVHNVIGQELLYNLPPFAQLAGLSRLSALHYAVYAGGDAPGGLPAGDCQLSMRHLAVEERLLQESRLWIEDAPALERLLIKWYVYPDCRAPGGRDFGDAKWDWLWRWAATHAPLRALCFDLGEGDEPTGLEAAAQRLRACRPTVRVEHCRFHAAWQELAAEWP